MKRNATCACGQLTLSHDGDITKTSICHCFECQKRTGSAFGLQTRLETEKVSIAGKSNVFQRVGDAGGTVSFHFCPNCGTTLFWEIDKLPGSTIVAAGSFLDPELPSPTFMVYSSRKHHWIKMPDTAIEYFD